MLEFVIYSWKIRGRFEKTTKSCSLAVSKILDLELLVASTGVCKKYNGNNYSQRDKKA